MEKQIVNDGAKRNYVTGRAYTGRNAAVLDCYDDIFFMTFLQGKECGFHLRKGSEGVALLLVDKRKGEKNGEEKNYFYKRGFTVFGLSCWEMNGFTIPEPLPDAPFPWVKQKDTAEKPEVRESKVFKDSSKPKETLKKKTAPVNNKSVSRAEFLKSAGAFFPSKCGNAYFSITSGKAIFMGRPSSSDWQMVVIENVSGPDYTTVIESNKVHSIIKGIDSFCDGLIGNKRVCHRNEVGAAEFFDAEAFQKLFAVSNTSDVSIPADVMRSVSYAAATDLVKPSFNAVCIAPGAVVASDSRRLAAHTFETGVKDDYIVPLNIAKNAVGTVRVFGNVARSECEHGFFAGKLVDGQFPRWQQVVPSIDGAHVLQSPRSLWAELKDVSQKPSFKSVFRPEGCFIVDLDDDGKPYERKVSDVSFPEPFGVNAAYMLDAVRETSTIHVVGSMQPIVIKTGDILDVVMPIQIK